MNSKQKTIVTAVGTALIILFVGTIIYNTYYTHVKMKQRLSAILEMKNNISTTYYVLTDIENAVSENRIILTTIINPNGEEGNFSENIDSMSARISEIKADIENFKNFTEAGNTITDEMYLQICDEYELIGSSVNEIKLQYQDTFNDLSEHIEDFSSTSDSTYNDIKNKLDTINNSFNSLNVKSADAYKSIVKETSSFFELFKTNTDEKKNTAWNTLTKDCASVNTAFNNLTIGTAEDTLSNTSFSDVLNNITFNNTTLSTDEQVFIESLSLNNIYNATVSANELSAFEVYKQLNYLDACYENYALKVELMMMYGKAGLVANLDALYQTHTGNNTELAASASFNAIASAIASLPEGAEVTSIEYLRHFHIDANGKVNGFVDANNDGIFDNLNGDDVIDEADYAAAPNAPQTIISDVAVGGCYVDMGHLGYERTEHKNSGVVKAGGAGYTYTTDWYTQSSHTETRYRPCDGRDDGTGHCNSCGIPLTGQGGPSGRECHNSIPYEATVTDTTYHTSPAHTYTCPCTNGQLVGVVINYTVDDTNATLTLTY